MTLNPYEETAVEKAQRLFNEKRSRAASRVRDLKITALSEILVPFGCRDHLPLCGLHIGWEFTTLKVYKSGESNRLELTRDTDGIWIIETFHDGPWADELSIAMQQAAVAKYESMSRDNFCPQSERTP